MVKVVPFFVLVICSISGIVTADDWWEHGHFYELYVRSFKDSDGDGIGDLNGITSKLEYFNYIGVTAIWLSPCFKSPMLDFGYDISDYRAISPEYGTMEDFECLIERAKELDIKILLDFVPNHVSNQHEWWLKAINSSDPEHAKYKDYFIWNKGKPLADGTRGVPSNWNNIFRGSMWKWVEEHQEFYLHQFLEQQPDLNYRNPVVVEEIKEVLRFWLRKGVNGFRIDSVPFLVETKENAEGYYNDETPRNDGVCKDNPEDACYYNHTQTQDQPESYDLLYGWRSVTDEVEFSASGTRILMVEGYTSLENTLRYYGEIVDNKIVRPGAQIPFNFMWKSNTWAGTGTYGYIDYAQQWLDNMPEGTEANWVLGNHDGNRIATKYWPRRTDIFNIMLKTTPGITVTYYGEEIGMTDVWISWADTVDPQALRTNSKEYLSYSRDLERTPFQWSDHKNSGFSEGNKTWLPLALNYTTCNVNYQVCQERSFLNTFTDLMKLRENPTMKYGGIEFVPFDTEIMAYKREIKGNDTADIVVVVINLFYNEKTIDLTSRFSGLPSEMEVVTSSIHSEVFLKGNMVSTSNLTVAEETGVVLIARKSKQEDEECEEDPPIRSGRSNIFIGLDIKH